jgi:hypothetical protein
VLFSTKLACLSLKKEADVDSGVIPEAFPEQETGFSESQNGGFFHSPRHSFKLKHDYYNIKELTVKLRMAFKWTYL